MKRRSRLESLGQLSSWDKPNGKVRLRQPNSFAKAFAQRQWGPNQTGQIVVEYVLLLVIAIVAATIITKAMISSDPNDPGFVLSAWTKVIQAIGADHPDDIERGQ